LHGLSLINETLKCQRFKSKPSSDRRYSRRFASRFISSLLGTRHADSINLYGQNFAVYNVHSLTHIVDDARKYGCLDSVSSFSFESFLGRLKRSVRKPQFVLQQISNRLSEGYFKPKSCQEQDVTLKKQHRAGPVVAGFINFKQYKEVHMNDYVLKTYGGDNCICFGDRHIGIVKNIVSDGNEIYLIVKRFKNLKAAFLEPLVSSDLGIYMLNDFDKGFDVCHLKDVCRKYVLLPIKDGRKWIGIPLLHTA
jgi:hypothetical protein